MSDDECPCPLCLAHESHNAAMRRLTAPLQRPATSKQDYGTPIAFLDATRRLLGIEAFDHDFAASEENTVARTFYYDDGAGGALAIDHWEDALAGGWGWLNPPFRDIAPWARKCAETRAAGGKIAFLVPASVGSNWYRDWVAPHARVLFLNGRLAFMPDRPTWLYPKDCLLALYAPTLVPGTEVWSWRSEVAPHVHL